MLRDVREQVADFNAAVAVLLELPRAAQGVTDVVELRGFDLCGEWLPIVFGKPRFRVERIDLRYATIHVQEDDVFGSRLEMTFARRERVATFVGNRVAGHHGRQSSRTKPLTGLSQKLTTAAWFASKSFAGKSHVHGLGVVSA